MKEKQKYLVTSALPYANGPIHLGHLAGAYLPADIFVRYCRLKKRDVVFICGSDEHGVPIMLRARKEGVSPQQIVDRYHEQNKKSFADVGMSFDFYGRTSSPVHHETSRDFFRKLAEKEEFILKSENQLYDPQAGVFLADRFVRGTCPSCGFDNAYGDQCEKCGTSLSPADLINPRSAITNAKPVLKETTHWYLPLEKYQPMLEKWVGSHKEWKSNVLGQIQSWFNDGLKDRAVTRDLDWGVAVPEDVAQKYGVDGKSKVLYVWFDAPIGYISATREWAQHMNKPDLWKDYWQDKNTKLYHFIGKDNIVFHCLIFPAMLMANGDYVLPQNVPANEFLNLEGEKISTSRNYAVWLEDYLKNFEPDSLRYCLTQIAPETKDSDFSWKDFQARHNNELADIIGNFVNRSFIFAHKYFDGKVPELFETDKYDQEAISRLKKAPAKIGKHFDKFQFRQGAKELMDLCRFANKYFNDQEPWVSQKSNPQKCSTTIHICLQIIRTIGLLMAPVLPFTTEKIGSLLQHDFNGDEWDSAGEMKLKAGHQIAKPEILFVKIEDDKIESEVQKLKPTPETPQTPLIKFEDFQKIDLRVAEIIEAEKVKKTDKLFQLKIKIGQELRNLIAGVAEHYTAEALIGKKIIVLANLEPATIRGITSEGMLLAAKDDAGNLSIISPDKDIITGSKVS